MRGVAVIQIAIDVIMNLIEGGKNLKVKQLAKKVKVSVKRIRDAIKLDEHGIRQAYDVDTDDLNHSDPSVLSFFESIGVDVRPEQLNEDHLKDREELEKRKIIEQTLKTQLEIEIKRGKLIPREQVDFIYKAMVNYSAKALSDVPKNVATQLYEIKDIDNITKDDYIEIVSNIIGSSISSFKKQLERAFSVIE